MPSCDAVVNFAAESHVDRSITGPEAFVKTNIVGTHRLLALARKLNIKKFVQISTDEVYGSLPDDGKFTEETPLAPNSPYSASKAALHNLTECLAQEFLEQNIKVNCLALGSAQTEMLEKAFPGYESPVMAFEMGKYIADFALTGHRFFNGKILPVAVTTP